jgi:hypothetical protein
MVMSSGSFNSHVKKSVANRLRRATHTHTPARSAGRKKTHLASPPHPSGKMGFFLDDPCGIVPAHTTRVQIEIEVVRRIFRPWGVSSYSARAKRVSAPVGCFRPWRVSSYSARAKRARSARVFVVRKGLKFAVLCFRRFYFVKGAFLYGCG